MPARRAAVPAAKVERRDQQTERDEDGVPRGQNGADTGHKAQGGVKSSARYWGVRCRRRLTSCQQEEEHGRCAEEHRQGLVQNRASAFVGGSRSQKEEAGKERREGSVEAMGDGDDNTRCCQGDGKREEPRGRLLIAENAGDDREQQRKQRRPMEIDIRVGAEGKIVLNGNEVCVQSAQLVERVRHGHATGAGPALKVAVEGLMENTRVEGYEQERGQRKPYCGSLDQIGMNRLGRVTLSGRGGLDDCAVQTEFSGLMRLLSCVNIDRFRTKRLRGKQCETSLAVGCDSRGVANVGHGCPGGSSGSGIEYVYWREYLS